MVKLITLTFHLSHGLWKGNKTTPSNLIRCSGIYRLFRCSTVFVECFGVFRGVPVLRCSGAPVLRCSGVPVFRCSGVPVFRCSGVPGFSTCRWNGQRPLWENHGILFNNLAKPFETLKSRKMVKKIGSRRTNQKLAKFPERSATLRNFVGFQTYVVKSLLHSWVSLARLRRK